MANVVFPEYVIVFVLIGQAAGMCGFVCVFFSVAVHVFWFVCMSV